MERFRRKFSQELKATLIWYGLLQLIMNMISLQIIPFVIVAVILIFTWLDY